MSASPLQRATEERRSLRARIKVDGARKVWGTHKSTTIGEVKGAISVLANIAPEDISVKEKIQDAGEIPGCACYCMVVCYKG
jgi:hypothetical protein